MYMKPYGVPRTTDVESPDVGDIKQYGLKSSSGNLPGKGGDIRSPHKSSDLKKKARRRFKRRERAAGKEATQQLESLITVYEMLLERFGEPIIDDDDDDVPVNEKAPPGGEKVVMALKKNKDVDNPFAVAWAMKNRGEI